MTMLERNRIDPAGPVLQAVLVLIGVLSVASCSQTGREAASRGTAGGGGEITDVAVRRLVEAYENGEGDRVRTLGDSLLGLSGGRAAEDRILLVMAQNEIYEEHPAAALEYAEELVTRYPESPSVPQAYYLLGEAYRARGDAYRATTAYLEAADRTPDESVRESARDQAYELIHGVLTYEELQRLAREATGSDIAPSIDFRIARRLFAEERYAEAAVRLVDFLSLYPSSPFAPEARKLLQAARERSGSAPQATPNVNPYRIGVLAPLSGRFSAYGDSYLKGTRIALDEYNRARPIPVQMSLGDSGGDPLRVLRATERLILEEGVIGISGPVLSMPTIAAATRAQCYGVPLMSSTATQEGIEGIGDFVFQNMVPREAEITSVLTLAVRDLLLGRVAILAPAYAGGLSTASFARDEVERLGGEVVALETFEEGATDFTESFERISEVSPDALLLLASIDELLLILPQVAFHDIQAQLLATSSVNTEKLLRVAAPELEGCIFPSDIYAGRTREENEQFKALYRELYHEEPNTIAVKAYFGARILLEALAAGATTRDEVRDYFVSLALSRNHPLSRIRQAEALSLLTIRDGKVRPFVMPNVAPPREPGDGGNPRR